MFVDTNAPEENQNLDHYNKSIKKQILLAIRSWYKDIPETSYKIIIVTQPFTKAVNIFTLQRRYGTRGMSKSLARFLPHRVTKNDLEDLTAAIKTAFPTLKISSE